jgi:hypothetical protein
LLSDRRGNVFLPISVADTATSLPQKGQYAFLLPLRYDNFFHHREAWLDSIVRGNLAMLDATTKEGLIVSSGWLHNGVWPWLGGIHAMAHQLFGNTSRAHDLLYAYANHAAPTGPWVEEQQTKDIGNATAGDVSNAEACAVFVHLVRLLWARERLDDLELLPGVPPEWLAPNAKIELNKIWTDFGPVTLRLTISPNGKTGSLVVASPDGRESKGRPIIFLRALQQLGFVFENGAPLPDKLVGTWGKMAKINFTKRN